MSRFGRLLPSVAATRRSYSIFASKSRGGRFFNSTKSSKVITQSPTQPPSATSTATNASNAGSSASPDPADTNSTEEVGTSLSQQPSTETHHPLSNHNAQPSSAAMSSPSIDFTPTRPHPVLKPNDLMLHQFFSLHRPFLLLNQPTSTLFESAPPESPSPSEYPAAPTPLGTIDDPPMASPETDADAARQLSRAIVMNRVANLADWESALARLGLDEIKEPIPPEPVGIRLDSTKRKRRKKMKKHKLKKRRRLQRAKRLRLGK